MEYFSKIMALFALCNDCFEGNRIPHLKVPYKLVHGHVLEDASVKYLVTTLNVDLTSHTTLVGFYFVGEYLTMSRNDRLWQAVATLKNSSFKVDNRVINC